MSDKSKIISQNKAIMNKIMKEITPIAKQESDKLKKSSGFNYLTDNKGRLYTDSDSYYYSDGNDDEDMFGMFCLLDININKIKVDDDFYWNDWSDTIFELVINLNNNKKISKYGKVHTEQPDDGDAIRFTVKPSLLKSTNNSSTEELGDNIAKNAAKDMEKQLSNIKIDGFKTDIKVYNSYGGVEILGRIEKPADDISEIKNRRSIVSSVRKQWNSIKKDIKSKYKDIFYNEPDELYDNFYSGKYSILFGIEIYNAHKNESVELWEQEIEEAMKQEEALKEASIYNF